ncbi:unnamed protein product [Lymnaea stagnalis]|uniref:TIR domain-containing protein n=1 Tax=Lymnaea stagnalis TaxID=6523 RepID=A0AAV2I6Z4_LYMST
MNFSGSLLSYFSLLAFLTSTSASPPYTQTQADGTPSGKALSSRPSSGQTLSGIAGTRRQVSGIDRFLSERPRKLRRFNGEKDRVGLLKNVTLSVVRKLTLSDVRNMTLSDVRNTTLGNIWNMTLSDVWNRTLSGERNITLNNIRNMTLSDMRSMTLRDARNMTLSGVRKNSQKSIEQGIHSSISTMSPSHLSSFGNQASKGVPVETDLVGSQAATHVPIEVPGHDNLNMPDQRSEYPCHVTRDVVYNGSLVDCTHGGINDVSRVEFPENTTTLILDRNNITVLRNQSFVKLTWLRRLSVRSANVSRIEVDALAGLPLLDVLNLEANSLPISSCAFPFHMFRHVPNLRTLLIGYNSKVKGTWVGEGRKTPGTSPQRMCGGGSEKSQYQSHIDIFDDLPHLETLSIDSFKTLLLGSEFSKFQNLQNLTLYCVVVQKAHNFSFQGLSVSNLTSLFLDTFYDYIVPIFPEGIFQPVPKLTSLKIHQCRIGNHNIQRTMWPFELGPMKTLLLDDLKLSRYRESPTLTLKDGILTKASMSHINNICLSSIALTNSKIFSLEPEAMTSPVWLKCLRHVDLSGNELGFSGWRVVLFQISWFLFLEDVTVTSPATSYQQVHPDFSSDLDKCYLNTRTGKQCSNSFPGLNNTRLKEDTSFYLKDFDSNTTFSPSSYQVVAKTDVETNKIPRRSDPTGRSTVKRRSPNVQLFNSSSYFSDVPLPIVWIRMPKSIRTIRIASITIQSFVHYVTNWVLLDSDHFSELYAINIPQFCYSRGRLLGLNNLRILDVSGSMMDVGEHFYDDFSNLEVLVLSSILPANYFDKIVSCKRLLRNLTRLNYLDISTNGLTRLSPDTFETTPALSHLVLANNRFSSIPLDLTTTPRLRVLDLSQNAILFLSKSEITALDDHASKVPHFLLKLDGNGLVCVCSVLNFLAWLTVSPVQFDNNGDYQCTSQKGQLTTTAAFSDIEALWRQCEGSTSFLTSLVLASLMALSFFAVFFIGRFKTAIIAVVLNIVAPQFRAKTPGDYKMTVFIGYADDDFRYVRNILLDYVEGALHSTTFIHQRDLGTGYTDQLFFEAMQDSWRILLVITGNFLDKYNMSNIVMKYASHSVSPVNQGRVFILVEESQLHKIPSYLHDVLDESRILTVSDLDLPLTYKLRQSIKRCLESHQ